MDHEKFLFFKRQTFLTLILQAGNYTKAKKMYKTIVDYLEEDENVEESLKEKRNSLLLAGHLNMAMCCLKVYLFVP